MSDSLRFDNKVVIVTGAGSGIGREYALFFASRGAKVVVNDLGGTVKGEGGSNAAADKVVNEIKAAGGVAVPNYNSVEDGDKIVKTALDAYGRVDVVINNAGILRDVSFANMKKEDWDLVLKVHLYGSYAVARAAWPIMREQKFGRIINTSSGSGLYGNFGQANYSAAKLGIHGLTMTLAKEGESRNIKVNTIAPVAATRMTETVMNKEMLEKLNPKYVVPLVAYLAHDSCADSGAVFECGGGYFAKLRYQRSEGVTFDGVPAPEDIRNNFEQIIDFSGENDYPNNNTGIMAKFLDEAVKAKLKPKKGQVVQTQQTGGQCPNAGKTQSTGNSGTTLKTDRVFQIMANFLSMGEGKSAVEKVQAVFQMEISLEKGKPPVKIWTIDLKNGNGKVFEGKADKPDATFSFTDDDFEQIVTGKLNPQSAFMTGRMKIKGNMKKATMFTPGLFPPPTPENAAKYGGASAGGASTQTQTQQSKPTQQSGPSLQSDQLFEMMSAYMASGEGASLIGKVGAVFAFEIMPVKGQPVARRWIIDLKNGKGSVSQAKVDQVDATFTMTDEDFVGVCKGTLNPQNAFMTGKMKIKGNMRKATMFTPDLFPAPTPENFAKYAKAKL